MPKNANTTKPPLSVDERTRKQWSAEARERAREYEPRTNVDNTPPGMDPDDAREYRFRIK